MISNKSYNLHAGILMTVLVGSAFVVHRQAEARYLAGGSYAAQETEISTDGARAAGGELLAAKAGSGQQAPDHGTNE